MSNEEILGPYSKADVDATLKMHTVMHVDNTVEFISTGNFTVEQLMQLMWAAASNLATNHNVVSIEVDGGVVNRFGKTSISNIECLTAEEHEYQLGLDYGNGNEPGYREYKD